MPITRLLARLGVGAAVVDAWIDDLVPIMPGSNVTGEMHITGGQVPQEVDNIYLTVGTQYWHEINDGKYRQDYILAQQEVSCHFLVQPGEERVLPFSIALPLHTPITFNGQQVYIRSGLNIEMAIDPTDTDMLSIQPHPLMQCVFGGMKALGFYLNSAECEYDRYHRFNVPYIQEFEFHPSGRYHYSLNEVDVMFRLRPDSVDVILEVDKRRRGLSGFVEAALDDLDMDERRTRLLLTEADLQRPVQDVAQQLNELIQRAMRQ